ncbi:MAG: VTT domain-containing protein [Acidobacteria bacterium]|nr:VTT domain-containing protein [Acidobacteriota bacterium]
MKTLKYMLTRYTAFLWHTLQALGIWGVLVAAAVDGAAVGLPVDVVVGGYVAQNHERWLIYVFMGASGSALGSLVIYALGYAGGEELLRKHVSPERFQKMHNAFEKHPFWSLMFPAMLPPPTPFKAFAIAAAVAEVSVGHFLVAIFFGRVVRFVVLALLIIYFGPGAVHVLRQSFTHHFHWVAAAVAVVLAGWLAVRRRKRAASNLAPTTKV